MALSNREPSLWIKLSVLLIIVFTMIGIAQGSILAYAYNQGVKLDDSKAIFSLLSDPNHMLVSKLLIGLNHLFAFVLAPILWAKYYYKINLKEYFSVRHFDPKYILMFILALVTMFPMMIYLGALIDKVPWPEWAQGLDSSSMEALSNLLKMNHVSDLLLNILIVGILPGLGEELLFRGVIQKEIHKKWSNPHLAIWIAALLFAIVHFQVSGFPAKLLIGALLGYAYWISGSLVLPIILHALNNSMATIALYFSGSNLNVSDEKNVAAEDIPILGVLIATALCIAMWYFIINHYKSQSRA